MIMHKNILVKISEFGALLNDTVNGIFIILYNFAPQFSPPFFNKNKNIFFSMIATGLFGHYYYFPPDI